MFGLGLSLYQGEDLPAVASLEEAKKVVITFGKHQGKTLDEIKDDEGYLRWLLNNTKDENLKVAVGYFVEALSDDEQDHKMNLIDTIMDYELKGENLDIIKDTYKVKSLENMIIPQLEQVVRRLNQKYGDK